MMMDPHAMARKLLETEHGDFMRCLAEEALKAVMESEVQMLCNAGYAERSDERSNSRNGYRERTLETRVGTIPLRIPKVREGTYLPSFLEPRRRWEKAFVQVVCEAYVKGVSTRKVEDLVEAMGATGMSSSQVSRMAAELDGQVAAFREQSLDGSHPYLWLDALYHKVRRGGRVVSMATLVAIAVNQDGERQVLGIDVADGEMEDAWRRFLEDLVDRGLKGVQLVISDAHAGLGAARRRVLNGTTWQRCRVHFMRNVLSRVPKAAKDFVSATVKHVFNQPGYKAASEAMNASAKMLEEKYPSVAELLTEATDDVLAYMTFPEQHWRQIHSTNGLERLNKEIRRRTDVVGIFPSRESAIRLVAMLLVEQNDEWAVGRRYFSMESMAMVIHRPNERPLLEDAA
jgi:putative transposase